MMLPFSSRKPTPGARSWALSLVFLALLPVQLLSQAQGQPASVGEILSAETWMAPPEAIAEAMLAPRHLNVTLSNPNAQKSWFLNEMGDGPLGIEAFSKPFHELGGLFVDFAANRNRNLTIRNNAGIELISAADGSKVQVQVPRGARVSGASWSPAGERIAFLAHFPDATYLYVAEASNGRSRQLVRNPLLAVAVTDVSWSQDGKVIAAVLLPENRGPMPNNPRVPTGPQVNLSEEGNNNLRTYPTLLATPHDQALLEWHVTGQVALIDVERGRVAPVGRPAMIRSLDLSPDGAHLRVTRTVKPFSYIVPVSQLGSVEEIWDRSGVVLATIRETPLNTGLRDTTGPQAADAQTGPRDLAWRADGQGLSFLEQEPAPEGADTAAAPAEGETRPRRKDRVMRWVAPFDSASLTVVYESNNRMSWHRFSPDTQILFASERSGQNVTDFAVFLDSPEERHTLVRYRADDFYANPGTLLTTDGGRAVGFGPGGGSPGSSGSTIQLSADGAHVFYQGVQYDKNPEEAGPRSFIDRVSIRDGEKDRIYESENEGVWERVLTPLDLEAGHYIVSRESATEVAQSYRREGDRLAQLTRNQDYTADLTTAPRERFMATRPDGTRFRVSVTLPPAYRPGTRLPAMFWFYPREYTSQENYEQSLRTYNKNAFPNFGARSIVFLVRLGYAVVEPDSPIMGQPGLMNDNYVHDLRTNLATVIDSLDARGLIDRGRLGLGGHSYGAFSTVNAMVHTPFFKAGIAGDGNYNRTLTPLTFQSERRTLWDARETYLNMSPILYARYLTGALLLYHGLHDQNVGTFPIHSPRLFQALNGLGKTVSMYEYAYEDHGPAARETLLDLWARWAAWLDKYVMNPQEPEAAPETR